MAQVELNVVRLEAPAPWPRPDPACPLHPPPLMDIPLQALHEVHTMQRQPRHQASHPRAVPDSTAAKGGLHPAPKGPAQGHTGPAPGSVSGSQGKPWGHPPAPVSAEPGPWEGEGMALLPLSSQPISLGPEAFLHACFLPIDDR